ncbi:hypothetical protein BDY21DRAFT_346833 [Lineolata rhizophorae]|uniref:Uncharacterized protein n=1 Tax=Lineolata rhizophorae TaxID=578093 RepID=A0A6A6NX12_9PEZI|nr:hypothetical protein BDY21DRAFT_346833 [Lineolata rhizophorae]
MSASASASSAAAAASFVAMVVPNRSSAAAGPACRASASRRRGNDEWRSVGERGGPASSIQFHSVRASDKAPVSIAAVSRALATGLLPGRAPDRCCLSSSCTSSTLSLGLNNSRNTPTASLTPLALTNSSNSSPVIVSFSVPRSASLTSDPFIRGRANAANSFRHASRFPRTQCCRNLARTVSSSAPSSSSPPLEASSSPMQRWYRC